MERTGLFKKTPNGLLPCDDTASALYLKVELGQGVYIDYVESSEARSIPQNRLQRQWLNEAAHQGDKTAEEYRGECKLHLGVPILRRHSELFREKYDRILKSMDYGTKLELMQEPMDFPITRLMTKDQKKEYLDAMHIHLTGQGLKLTDPNAEFYHCKAAQA